jgi:BirA family transcriptional regulator, biotin operon repressor / biotin---[acetyl-CoA-carboxylase] ligase
MQTEPRTPSDDVTADNLLPLLKTAAIGRKMYAFNRCESTSVFARRLLESHEPTAAVSLDALHGTIVTADCQTGGRGRNGNAWMAAPRSSLLFSVILDPARCGDARPESSAPDEQPVSAERRSFEPPESNRTTLASAVAVVLALHKMGAADCSIKWPNDVLAPDGRKLCGILTERVARRGASAALITGIGINVNQVEEDFPEDLRSRATSLRQVLGHSISRLSLLAEVLESLERSLALSLGVLFAKWHRHCSTLGRHVTVQTPDGEAFGHAVGLEWDGSLILRLENGVLQTYHSGEVREVRGKRDA